MEKRDLKADLEELKSLKEDDVHFMSIVCFIENNAEKWLEQGVVELERAVKAEGLNDMLVKYNKSLVAKVLNKQKRSKQLEALARELAGMLIAVRRWVESTDVLGIVGKEGIEVHSDSVADAIDEMIIHAREVLGDD